MELKDSKLLGNDARNYMILLRIIMRPKEREKLWLIKNAMNSKHGTTENKRPVISFGRRTLAKMWKTSQYTRPRNLF